jgi:hypothetical protein
MQSSLTKFTWSGFWKLSFVDTCLQWAVSDLATNHQLEFVTLAGGWDCEIFWEILIQFLLALYGIFVEYVLHCKQICRKIQRLVSNRKSCKDPILQLLPRSCWSKHFAHMSLFPTCSWILHVSFKLQWDCGSLSRSNPIQFNPKGLFSLDSIRGACLRQLLIIFTEMKTLLETFSNVIVLVK